MAFDFKKEYKEFYMPKNRPEIVRYAKSMGCLLIPPSRNKGMDYKEYTEAKRGTSWKQKAQADHRPACHHSEGLR